MKSTGQRIEDLEGRSFARFDPDRPLVIMHYQDDPPLDLEPEDGCPIIIRRTGKRPPEAKLA